MRKMIRDYVKGCQTDQRAELDQHTPYSQLGDHDILEDEGSRIYMD